MSIFENPPLDQWSLRRWPGPIPASVLDARRLAFADANENAARLALGHVDASRLGRVVGTGHQAWLWHPGILAKDTRAASIARERDAALLHVVVDHDVHAALSLDLPLVRGERLAARRVSLGAENLDVPSGCQPPVPGEQAAARAMSLVAEHRGELPSSVEAGLVKLADAFRAVAAAGGARTLAEQVTAVKWRMAGGSAWARETGVMFGTQMHRWPCFQGWVESLLADAERAMAGYNESTRRFPEAGVGELRVERERVELPVWWLSWNAPRRRVFADLSDTRPALVLEDGTETSTQNGTEAGFLAPRALSLTAVFRGWLCDGFVHGKGGGVYDRILDQWWAAWPGAGATGASLAPMAVVSADLRLPFAAPVATEADRRRAQWRARWLPHNIDRAGGAPDARKLALLAAMEKIGERRTKRARNAARFRELHAINESLVEANRALMDAAQMELTRAEAGCDNRAVALRRDWFWGFYDDASLSALA